MCNLNALIDRRTAIEKRLAELGLRIEPSLSSLDSETDLDSLFSLETDELVDAPDEETVELMIAWSSLCTEISATQHAHACGWSSLDQYRAHQAVLDARQSALKQLRDYQECEQARNLRKELGSGLIIPTSLERRLMMINAPVVCTSSGIVLVLSADFFAGSASVSGELRITTGLWCDRVLEDATRSVWFYSDVLDALNSDRVAPVLAQSVSVVDVFVSNLWIGGTAI